MKKWLLTIVVALGLMVLAACGDESSEVDDAKASKDPIEIGFSALPSWYLWHLVEEKGFFEKHDVNVELVWFPVYADSLSALNTGEIDGNSQAMFDTVAPTASGIDLTTAFIMDNSNGGDGLVAKPEFKSVEDLKGKVIGTEIGTIAHFFLLTALQDAGLTEDDIKFTNLAVQDAGTSFVAGNLDAASLWEPFLSIAQAEGAGQKLTTSADYKGLIADTLVFQTDVAKERKEDVQKITAAWFDAVDYLQENFDESIKLMADAAGISEEEMRVGIEGFKFFSIEDNQEALQQAEDFTSIYYTIDKNAHFLKDLGYIDEVPDFTNFIDTTFIEAELNRVKE
ncbi:MAG: ABC transporter substrate-binding protein [Lysinibacillus sp.]